MIIKGIMAEIVSCSSLEQDRFCNFVLIESFESFEDLLQNHALVQKKISFLIFLCLINKMLRTMA